MELYSVYLQAKLFNWDKETVDISMFDTDVQGTSEKGFRVSKATTFLERCGYTTDPKCALGQPIKELAFTVAVDNIDAEELCRNETSVSELVNDLILGYSSMLGGSPSDYAVELCGNLMASSRRLPSADPEALEYTVRVTESPATDIDTLVQVKQEKDESGELAEVSVDMLEDAEVPNVDATVRSTASINAFQNGTVGSAKATSVADVQKIAKGIGSATRSTPAQEESTTTSGQGNTAAQDQSTISASVFGGSTTTSSGVSNAVSNDRSTSKPKIATSSMSSDRTSLTALVFSMALSQLLL